MDNMDNVLEELKKRLLAVVDEYKKFSRSNPQQGSTTPPAANGENKPAETKPANGENKPAETKPATPVVASKTLSASVGDKGTNKPEDVLLVKTLLNKFTKSFNLNDAATNSKVGPTTIGVIKKFQQEKVGLTTPDGLIDVGGKTWKVLNGETKPIEAAGGGSQGAASEPGKDFSHPNASGVTLTYSSGGSAHPLNDRAAKLLKSILASCGMKSAQINSTKRTFADQARIMLQNPTYGEMAGLYGAETANAGFKQGKTRAQFADWLKERYLKTGKGSKHIAGFAIDIVPGGNRTIFVDKIYALKGKGTGVHHIIPLGQDGEKVDHIEFTFEVTNIKGIQ